MEQHNKSPYTGWLGRFVARIFRRKTLWSLSLAAAGALSVAAYAMLATVSGSIRIAPVAITVNSDSSLPPEVRALEAQTAPLLFDRDTKSEHVAYAAHSIDLKLERLGEIQAIKVYGPAPYELSVQAQQGGAWNTIGGLDKLKLDRLSAAWSQFNASRSVSTGALRLLITPVNGNPGNAGGKGGNNNAGSTVATGLPEIEIWAAGEHALLRGEALVKAWPSDLGASATGTGSATPPQTRAYAASPATVVVGQDGQTLRFTLDRPAQRFKRAWLSYEAYGLAHWVSPVRRVNGQTSQGGSYTFSGNGWAALAEPIHPDWLRQGDNRIDFSLPPKTAGSYSVRNVRVIAELDDGHNFIARATTAINGSGANAVNTVEADTAALIDGDLATGWSPYRDPRGKSGQPELILYFDKPTQLDSLNLNLVNALGGTVSLDLLVGGLWQNAGLSAINGAKLGAGWNQLSGFAAVPAQALRITFQNGTGSAAEIREITATGSGVGAAHAPAIAVAYPDAGQFYGRSAYLRGYLSLPDNGSGPATLSLSVPAATANGTPSLRPVSLGGDGSFGLLVSKDEVGYARQTDAEPWQVQLVAQYPNAQQITQAVLLSQGYDASKARGQLPTGVNPGLAAVLVGGDASLEIGPDALDKTTDVRITPLREDQLPRLDPGMTNVTRGPHRGYRFTPTPFKFKNSIKVTLPYDSAFIPRGHTEADVKTYYYDKQAGRWVPLDRVDVDRGKKRVTSLTDHFTDMINATLTVPDHPQTVSFNPTQLKDIKAADPGAGINLIEPPKANNTGDARLSYPIEIPPGRQGMQPQLAIQYNSGAAGGNGGWLGLGWDLSVPSIGIETRWGVPRYDMGDATANPPRPAKESETYTLNGEQLVPLDADGKPGLMPHRAAWDRLENRSAGDKRYLARVEGAFRKIVRHGTSPTNYWWEVTDKNGTRHFYGGVDAQDASGKLGGEKGVFRWLLLKSVDASGNTVVYGYDKVCDTGTGDGHNANGDALCEAPGGQTIVPGYQLYLKEVRYTGHPKLDAPYSVRFIRDNSRRADVSIDARGGFKQVTAHRLKTIEVKYSGQMVRSYELIYNQDAYGKGAGGGSDTAFGKTLLTAVVQKGDDGTEFNRHAFEYFDRVREGDGSVLSLFAPVQPGIDAQQDRLAPSGADPLLAQLLALPQTLVGGNLGVNAGFNGFFGIGWPTMGENIHVAVTASGNASVSQSNLALIDIDGDGRPDKVFERDGTVYYRKNTSNPASGTVSFQGGEPATVQGLSRLGDSESLSWGVGVKGKLFAATAYAKDNHTVITDAIYFADVNGDGLVDQVNNRTVNFNRRLGEGQYAFNAQSAGTPTPIRAGTIDAAQLLSAMAAERAAMEQANPLMDAVRRWVAPYDGRVTISGDVRLHNFRTDATLSPGERDRRQRYETADGLRVSIQHGDQEIWAANIGAEDYTAKSPAQTYLESVPALTQKRQVRKGEVLYFRAHSKYDGNYDRVHWAPQIQYVDAAGQALEYADASQRNAYLYRGDVDHVLASGRSMRMVATNYGTVRIEGQLQKTGVTSDDVSLVVEISAGIKDAAGNAQRVVYPEKSLVKTLKWNETGTIVLDHGVEVDKGQSIAIRIASDSPIDLSKLRWLGEGSPRLYYTYAYEPEVQVKQPPRDASQTASSQLPSSADAVTPDVGKMTSDGGVLPRRELAVTGPDGQWIYQIQAAYDADIYSVSTEGSSPQAPWVASRDGVILITPWAGLKTYAEGCTSTGEGGATGCMDVSRAPDGDMAFTVKRNGQLLAKQIIQVRNQALVPSTYGYRGVQAVEVKAGDKLFFDFSVRDPLLAAEILSTNAYFSYGSASAWQAPLSDTVDLRVVLQAGVDEQTGDATPPPSGTVLFVARRGGEIVERKEFTVYNNYAQLEHLFKRAVQAGESYAFDFLTVDPRVNVAKHEAWTTYTGVAAWRAPKAGALAVTPRLNFSRPATGALTLNVLQNGRLAASQIYSLVDGALTAGQLPLTLNVAAGDNLRFEYSTNDHVLSSALADKGAVAIDYAQPTLWSVPSNWGGANLALTMQPRLSLASGATGAGASGSVTLRVWRGVTLLSDTRFTVASGQIVSGAGLPLTLAVNSGDVLGFEYVSDSQALLDALRDHDVELSSGNNRATVTAALNAGGIEYGSQALIIRMPEAFKLHPKEGSVRHYAVFHDLYGNPYRGWSYIGYNSDHSAVGAPASKPLMQTQLRRQSEAEIKDPRSERPAYLAFPTGKTQRWESLDDNWWIGADQISSSRRGVDQINVPDAASFVASGNVMRVPRRSSGNTFSAGGGMYLTINFSNGRSGGELDLVDLNGDRYPDVVGGGHVQYTEPGGNLAETLAVLNTTNTSTSDGLSISIGPSPQESSETAKGVKPDTGIRKPSNPEKGPVPFSAGIDSGNSNVEIQLADINGDGLPDQLIRESDGLKVRLNLGYAFAAKEPWGSAALNRGETVGLSFDVISYNSNDGKEQLTDINGDGLPDRVVSGSNGELKVNFNTGNGFGPQRTITGFVQTNALLPGGLGAGLNLPASHTTLYDGASLSATYGHGFTYAYTIWCAMVPCLDLVWGGGVNVGATMTQPTIALRDIDGDGLPDGIRSPSSDKADVALNQAGKTNLLKAIRRPLGAVIELDYARSGNTYAQPHSKWVMSELRVYDGVAGDTPADWKSMGSDWQRLSFAYEQGQYDRYERDFLGYGQVTTRVHDSGGKHGLSAAAELASTPVLRRSEQQYINSTVHGKGLLINETAYAVQAGQEQTISRGVNQYDYWRVGLVSVTGQGNQGRVVDPGDLQQFPAFDAGNQPQPENSRATAVLFPRLARSDRYFYENGASEQSSYSTQLYDGWGNVTFFEEGGSGVEPVQAQIAYSGASGGDVATCQTKHIVGLPNSIIVTAGGKQMRRREGWVNCVSAKLDWQRAYFDANHHAQTDLGWDDYGNLRTIKGPENHQGQRLELLYGYDYTETASYPTGIENKSYGIRSGASYDYRWGKPLTTTDANDQEISYAYDPFGRTTQIRGPQEKTAGKDWTIRFSYTPCLDLTASGCKSWARTEHADRQVLPDGSASYKNDPIETLLLADGLKRILQTKKDAAVADAAGSPSRDSMIASGRVAFDALGRTIAQYYPTASLKGAADSAHLEEPDTTVRPTVTDFDAQDRPLKTRLPDGTETVMAYGFGPDAFSTMRFKTEVTDALGNKKQSLRDVRGLITTVVEQNRRFDKQGQPSGGKTPVATRYVYDPLKQITQVIDAAGNTTTVEYDELGRRTAITNPDTGRTETVYDAASNPVQKITAKLRDKGQAVQYRYDHTRLLAIQYPQYPDANVAYVYGTSSDKAKNQAGRVKQVTHQSGTELREYGSLGEVVKETLTLTAAANGGSRPPVYTTSYDFDSFGRLHRLTMPDGEVIRNAYDSGGNLQSIHGRLNGAAYDYLQRLDYDRFESRLYLVSGNGMETKYSYDPANRRLARLHSGSAGKNALQDLAYGYDPVGNITTLNDRAPIPKSNEYGGQSSQNFHYDDLYRLVKAEGVYTTAREVQAYDFAMEYDAIHNIRHKHQQHTVSKVGGTPRIETATTYDWAYAYQERRHTQPHAPTTIGNRTFDYDLNGNQAGWQNLDNGTRRVIVWDEDNRIREVQDPKHGAAFSYDDRGERKLKKSQYGETAYINQFFTVRNGAIASTHVYAGASRIVTKLGAGTPVGKVGNGNNLQGTGNLSPAHASLTEYVAGETNTAATTAALPSLMPGKGQGKAQGQTGTALRGQGEGQSANTPGSFPGQGLEHRSDRANEVARNTEKNKHLNGGDPGGVQGAVNSNADGNASNAGGNGNAWGRTGEHGNSGQVNNGHAGGNGQGNGQGSGNAGGGNGSINGNGGNGGGGGSTGGTGEGREFIYFYHPDHLGSTAYVTDEKANRYEHLAYFPFGETWVQESTATWRVPYQYTAKEMDSETGLYYFGARYYDPRTSVWVNADPALRNGRYFIDLTNPDHARGEFAPFRDLPGGGGIYNPLNLAAFTYVHQNPIKLTDPDGEVPFLAVTGGVGALVGGAAGAIISYKQTGSVTWQAVVGGATAGGLIGLGSGAGLAYFAAGSTTAGTGAVIAGLGTSFTTTAAALGSGGAAVQQLIRNSLDGSRWQSLRTTAGEVIRITPSAVKHLQEWASRSSVTQNPLSMKLLGESYIKAIDQAAQMGIKFGEKMNVGGWELIFQRARDTGATVLHHAVPIARAAE